MNKKKAIIIGVVSGLLLAGAIIGLAIGLTLGTNADLGAAPNDVPKDSRSTPKLINPTSSASKIANEWILVAKGENSNELSDIEDDLNSKPSMPWAVGTRYEDLGIMTLTCDESVVTDMINMPAVRANARYVEADTLVSVNELWGLDRIDQRDLPLNRQAFNPGQTGTGVNVYVIDTGIRETHNEFQTNTGSRATLDFSAINDNNGPRDCNGHGTHVSGTVGGKTWGIARNARLHAVRVLGCDGSGSNSGVIAGVNWVKTNHVKPAIASMSLGGGASTALDTAVASAIQAGVFFAVAAGNENSDACGVSPARTPAAVTVGATTVTDSRASFSNFGSCVDIFAPGVQITSAWFTSDTANVNISGTSMATPHVSGVAALYLQTNPTATPATVANYLTNTATPNKVTDPQGSPNKLLYWSNTNTQTSTTGRQSTATTGRQAATTGRPATTGGNTGPCGTTACTNETGTLAGTGSQNLHPGGTYFRQTVATFNHAAWLEGPASPVDFDLILYKWTAANSRWAQVAISESATSKEYIYAPNQTPGYYQWVVSSWSGAGSYRIAMQLPS